MQLGVSVPVLETVAGLENLVVILIVFQEFEVSDLQNEFPQDMQACGILPHSCIVISLPLALVITYSVVQGNLSLSYR